MPNLDHDPQNPTDLLGRPLKNGDVVAWGTTYGRSAALCVCVLEKIRFVRKDPSGHRGNVECPQRIAENYTLRLRPIMSTASVTRVHKNDGANETGSGPDYIPYTHQGYTGSHGRHVDYDDPRKWAYKTKSVLLVKNVVKLNLTLEEAEALAYAADVGS